MIGTFAKKVQKLWDNLGKLVYLHQYVGVCRAMESIRQGNELYMYIMYMFTIISDIFIKFKGGVFIKHLIAAPNTQNRLVLPLLRTWTQIVIH